MPAVTPLVRAFAYSVAPGSATQPAGGAVTLGKDVSGALVDAYAKASLDHALPVSFVFDAQRRNPVRELLLAIAFSREPEARRAASQLAERLRDSMDKRSKPGLLVVSVGAARNSTRRQVVVWLFPKDEAFRPSAQGRLILLDDIFSRSSGLRKAAMFQGSQSRSSFLSGRVLDSQANVSDRYLADFWLVDFLNAQLQMTSKEGTDLFGRALKVTNGAIEEGPAKDQLYAAISAVRTNPRRRWSLDEFAEAFLSGDTKTRFLESAPNIDSRKAPFDLDVERLDNLIQFRVFRLESGTSVSAPFAEVGQSVTVEEHDGKRTLQVRGVVVEERLRARRGT